MLFKKDFSYHITSLLGPRDFASLWGEEYLVRLPYQEIPGHLVPPVNHEFLIETGMPAFIEFQTGTGKSQFTACPLTEGLASLFDQPNLVRFLTVDCASYRIFAGEEAGSEMFYWCFDETSRHVFRVSPNREMPVQFVNSSVVHLATAFALCTMWMEESAQVSLRWGEQIDRITNDMALLDLESMHEDNNGFWRSFLGSIRSEQPALPVFRKGTMAEGLALVEKPVPA